MKRIISGFLCLIITFSVCACAGGNGGGNGNEEQSNPPAASEVLSIAKKYYDYHSNILDGSLKSELSRDVGAVNFEGNLNDSNKAEELCSNASLIAAFEGEGNYALACSAAAVGWSHEYARSTGTLAAVLETAGFATDKDRLKDAKKLALYAVSLDEEDAGLYLTLAQIQHDLDDNDGAIKSLDSALAKESDDNAASKFMLELLLVGGGATSDPPIIVIGNKIKESDGELSKRDTKQENDTDSIESSKEEDSKEKALNNLEKIYKLEPITPADMVKTLAPSKAASFYGQVFDIESDFKDLDLPAFPSSTALLDTNYWLYGGGLTKYLEWGTNQIQAANNMVLKLSGSTSKPKGNPMTAVDYMIDYNEQVLSAARNNYHRYCSRVYLDTLKIIQEREIICEQKQDQAKITFENAIKSDPEHWDYYYLIYALAVNNAFTEGITAIMPEMEKWYGLVKEEGQRLWEKTLPYARCSSNPEQKIADLQHFIYVDEAMSVLGLAATEAAAFGLYIPGISYGDLIKAEAALAEATAKPFVQKSKLKDITVTISLGIVELKLSNNKVEAEVVAGLAARVSYDWKKKQSEIGAGAGVKWKMGISSAKVGAEAKGYANIVFDMRNNYEVTDIYLSSEAKAVAGVGGIGGEAGVTGKISLMGNGANVSRTIKATAANVGIEHEKELKLIQSK